MEARPTGTANVARTSEGRCGGAIARTEIYMSLPLPLKQNESHPHRLSTNSPYHQLRIPSPESIQVSLAYLTALHCHSDTITMHSTEFKNWVTALVVGIPGLLLMIFAAVVAYKQLRRTKRLDDAENAAAENIELREIAVVIEGTENSQ
jgi:hypothetical protein